MIALAGHFALVLALLFAVMQVAITGRTRSFSIAVFLCVACAFATLTTAHVLDDFSLLNVALNSEIHKPLAYKITGAWASAEGSMLLWAFVATLYGAALALCQRGMPKALRERALRIQGLLSSLSLAYILVAADPFQTVSPVPTDGAGMNPLLMHPALALHPPALYLGYVGLSPVFALAVAFLLTPGINARDVRWMTPWITLAWTFLTLGVALGSWWAYDVLGWGGWWFWDPVENAALLPWLVATSLMHSAAVTAKRGALLRWTLFLAIAAFGCSLIGAFLTRSGLMTSVHAFALDGGRVCLTLLLFALPVGGALCLYATSAYRLPDGPAVAPVSREGALLINNLFLGTASGTLLCGTLYPLFLEAVGGGVVSVGAPWFDETIVPLLLPALLFMGVAPFLRWRQANARDMLAAAGVGAVLYLCALIVLLYNDGFHHIMAAVAALFAAWAIGGTLADGWRHRRTLAPALPRLLAHLGVSIAVLGMAASAWNQLYLFEMKPGESRDAESYRLSFESMEAAKPAPYYTSLRGRFVLTGQGRTLTLSPEIRSYRKRGETLSRIALHADMGRVFYLALGDKAEEGGYSVRLQIQPCVLLIWAGAGIAVGGGLAAALRFALKPHP
jgi:cytochrome c-type biogenesis protein CcmF